MTAATQPSPRNHCQVSDNRSFAVCCCCNSPSPIVPNDGDGEPHLDSLPAGWTQAPYPVDSKHRDGSIGSTYTCPDCNTDRLHGKALQPRAGSVHDLLLDRRSP